MPPSPGYRDIPILLIDIVGFTSRYRGLAQQRLVLQDLQRLLTTSARFFMPYGDPWSKWTRHGTGDGYYFLFDGFDSQIALEYALQIRDAVAAFNRETEPALALRLRMVLAYGDVEWVEDQLLSDAFVEAERLISAQLIRDYAEAQESPAAPVATSLFHTKLRSSLAEKVYFPEIEKLEWTRIKVTDKHANTHEGYVLGRSWQPPLQVAVPPPPRLRVTILIGHFLENPIPEAVEMATGSVQALRQEALHVDVRVDVASSAALRRTIAEGCDLLIYYGHGTRDGQLSFEDGPKAYAHLAGSPPMDEFWSGLRACFIFACYGDRFASNLPCPWVAFSGPILRLAPKGFLQAIIRRLPRYDLDSAVKQARQECEPHMDSSFSEVMRFSGEPIPPLRVGPGEPVLSRLTPGLSGKVRLDFASIGEGDSRYPDDEPFVGRVADLKSLLKLPSPYSDRLLQRVVWVHGDAGMGKSALLRHFAIQIRDFAFHDLDDPVYLLHLYCHNFTKKAEVASALCAAGRELYRLSETPDSVETLFRVLEAQRGIHIWVLDDLTYLSVSPDSTEEAAALVSGIRQGAHAHVLPLQLVASARRPGPAAFENVRVTPLTFGEAQTLARLVLAQHGRTEVDSADWIGAARVFHFAGGLPAQYKRALMLAADQGISFSDYADGLRERASLSDLEASEWARDMVAYEVEQLQALEARHGFAYSRFLQTYYPLVTRAAYFTLDELVSWFGERLRTDGDTRPLATAYRNGLTYLARLNFVLLQNRPERIAFAMPPNQRLSMRSLADAAVVLPPGVPLRGASERLSLALERAKIGDLQALADLLAMEEDYKPYMSEPSAAAAVFYSMLVRAEVLKDLASPGSPAQLAAIALLEQVDALYNQHARAYPADEVAASSAVATALVNKGVTLGSLGRAEEAIATYDQVVARFGERPEAALAEQVAKALVNKGVRLGSLGRAEEAIATYDQVVVRFGERPEAALAEQVAKALVN
ncbi:MAG: NACHT domain-containing protein, partial [Chloroflexi bacterium]|nr:NACHT domain-containing protein [Chloroflexota bacterium]